MSRNKQSVLEYRTYELPADFPMLVLTGPQWAISPVQSNRLHIHNCLEIGLCNSESGFMMFGKQKTEFRAGDVTFVSRNIPHTTWSAPGCYSMWSYLYMDAEGVLGEQGLNQLQDLGMFYRMLSDAHFLLPASQYSWAGPIVQSIMKEYLDQCPGYRASIRGLVLSLMIRLLRLYTTDRTLNRDRELSTLVPALDYLRLHFDQNFPMETLPALCHISPTHFRRLFSAQMGTNPLNYLHQLRVLRSCRLLRATDKTVAEIATMVGYPTLCSFNQHFRQQMNCTPSAWRRSGEQERPILTTCTGWTRAEEPKYG